MQLWNKNQELLFFNKYKDNLSPDQLFYRTYDSRYLAYWPKNYKGKKTTLQSRNSLIGEFTEDYVSKLFESLAGDDLYVIRQAKIPAIGISSSSPVDIVIASKNKKVLSPCDVKVIFEVKMSLVWNWEYNIRTNEVSEIGDYRTHQAKPSFTRSDSILKAIGKCIDIRVSSWQASKIPLIVLGNAPLSNGFCKKADYLKSSGIIQGFWSLNPFPLNHGNTRKTTPGKGYVRFDDVGELNSYLNDLFNQNLNFFSGMATLEELGHLIELSDSKETLREKGLAFLTMLGKS